MLPCQTLGKFFHSTLQFTQLYEWLPGYKHWWTDICVGIVSALMAGCFSEKPRWCSIEQIWQGGKCKVSFQQELDTALYKNLTFKVSEESVKYSSWQLCGYKNVSSYVASSPQKNNCLRHDNDIQTDRPAIRQIIHRVINSFADRRIVRILASKHQIINTMSSRRRIIESLATDTQVKNAPCSSQWKPIDVL